MARLPPSAFGLLTKQLQGHERRRDFASRLAVGEGTIANIRSGERQRSDKLMTALIEAFPGREEEIADAYERSPEPKTTRSPKVSKGLGQKRVEAQLRFGRVSEARKAITLQLETESEEGERFWLYQKLADICFSESVDEDGLEALASAIEAGEHVPAANGRAIVLRNRLASRLQRRDEFAAAHAVLDRGLLLDREADLLWRRKGIVHWYEHAYSDAYAALATALQFKHPLRRIIHSRGCVLAEWGNYEAALRDLNDILDSGKYQFTPISAAYARTHRAYVFSKLGETERALGEFSQAEQIIPDSSWLHYFRALCYLDSGQTQLAIEGLALALSCQGTHLNLPKRLHAEEILHDLGAPLPNTKP
jgi:tetratricopeptide (TPR) repeat protein